MIKVIKRSMYTKYTFHITINYVEGHRLLLSNRLCYLINGEELLYQIYFDQGHLLDHQRFLIIIYLFIYEHY